jgi:DNA-binding transcriptional regulator YiaG
MKLPPDQAAQHADMNRIISDPACVTEWAENIIPSDLKEIRTKMGLSQQVMGKLLGVATSSIFKWEKGNRIPHRYAVYFMLFQAFTNLRSIKKGSIASIMENGGEPLAMFKVLTAIYKELNEHQQEDEP